MKPMDEEKRTSALRSGGVFFFVLALSVSVGEMMGITRIGLFCLFRPGFGGGG